MWRGEWCGGHANRKVICIDLCIFTFKMNIKVVLSFLEQRED